MKRVTLFVVSVMLFAAVASLWVMRAPTSQAPEPVQPEVVVDDTLTTEEYIFQGAKYTRLSTNKPEGLPAQVPYGGTDRVGQAAIPTDTEPAIWSNDWNEGLTGEQAKMYAEGLVRSGLEDLGMCKPGYTCHGTVNYRIYDQTAVPQQTRMQLSLTTPTQHQEMFLFVEGGRGKVWFNTGAGWNFTGVVEELPQNDQTTVYKLMSSSSLNDMKY